MINTYKQNNVRRSSMKSVEMSEGMTIERTVELFMNNQTDIERQSPLIYTERKDGIMAGFDIRTDRFEIAIEAMDKSAKSMTAKRQSKMEVVKEDNGEDGKAEPTQGTENK